MKIFVSTMGLFLLCGFAWASSSMPANKQQNNSMKEKPIMKCAPGKCGGKMQQKPIMKCAPGKCGSGMKKAEPKKEK